MPFSIDYVRLELRLEFYSFRVYVPYYENFVAGCLSYDIRIEWAPAYSGDVSICKSKELNKLERFLVVNMDCKGGCESKLICSACQDLLLPYLHA